MTDYFKRVLNGGDLRSDVIWLLQGDETWDPCFCCCCCCIASVVSDSVWPQRRQPTRPRRPWDSPSKNTGVVAISFSNACKWKLKVKSLSHVRLLATPWTAAYQAPLSMGFSRREYWSGVPLPTLKSGLMNLRAPLAPEYFIFIYFRMGPLRTFVV